MLTHSSRYSKIRTIYYYRKKVYFVIDILDAHTHTIASGHAYSTLQEMITSAQNKNLKLLGITEHTPNMPGSCSEIYFYNFKVIPRKQNNLLIRLGAEINIMDFEGNMDLSEKAFNKIDYGIASLHDLCIEPGSQEQNTNAILMAMKHPKVKIIGHPDNGFYPINYEKIVQAAKEYHVLLELNNSSIHPETGRLNSRENMQTMLKYCLHYQTNLIIDSDAHIANDVGNHQYVHEILTAMNFPSTLIVNTSVDKFKEYID